MQRIASPRSLDTACERAQATAYRNGWCGDESGRIYDADGQLVAPSLDALVTALTPPRQWVVSGLLADSVRAGLARTQKADSETFVVAECADGTPFTLTPTTNVLVTGRPGSGASYTCAHIAERAAEHGWDAACYLDRPYFAAPDEARPPRGEVRLTYPDNATTPTQAGGFVNQRLTKARGGDTFTRRLVVIDDLAIMHSMAEGPVMDDALIEHIAALMDDDRTGVIIRTTRPTTLPKALVSRLGLLIHMDRRSPHDRRRPRPVGSAQVVTDLDYPGTMFSVIERTGSLPDDYETTDIVVRMMPPSAMFG